METTTKPVRFRSMCPKCATIQPQPGYDRNSLLRLLNGGYPVEAYCAACDEYWPVSTKERAALGAAAIKVSPVGGPWATEPRAPIVFHSRCSRSSLP